MPRKRVQTMFANAAPSLTATEQRFERAKAAAFSQHERDTVSRDAKTARLRAQREAAEAEATKVKS